MGKFKVFSILVFGLFLLGLSKTTLAVAPKATPTPQPSQDSYVLFYPVVAGKTEGDSLYFLKLVRDRLGELFTFGNEKKSEYNLRIATKRLLEAEKLFKADKANLARKTLSKFTTKLASSYDLAMKAKENESFPEFLDQVSDKTQKYQIVLNQLLAISPESEKNQVEESIERVTEIQNKVNQEIKGE